MVMILLASLILLSNREFVAEITNFGTFIIFAFVNLSAIALRYKKPEWPKLFKTPVEIGKMPLIPLIGVLSCGMLITQFNVEIVAIIGVIFLIGIATQNITTRWR